MKDDKTRKNKTILILLIFVATIILVAVGSSFAYFSTMAESAPNAVNVRAAEFSLGLEDDTTLVKSNIIPSIEAYVDIASKRTDANGFLKPYDDGNGHTVTAGTTCIDDNLNEICSVYTFTLINELTGTDIPLYITLNPSVNTFENLYFKVLDSSLNEVISKTHLVDDRPYTLDENDNKVYENGSTISPVVLTNINTTLSRAVDSTHPSTVTYSIVMWVDETNTNQNDSDSGKLFTSTLRATVSGANGGGITGVIAAAGTDG